MQGDIPDNEVHELLSLIRTSMDFHGFTKDTIEGTKIRIIHLDSWEVSVFVPYSFMKAGDIRRGMDKVLFTDCAVRRDCCDYLGRQSEEKAYEWYFRHPNVPEEVAERIEAEIEEEEGTDMSLDLPMPSGSLSNSDTVFLSLREEYFRAIQRGKKTKECRSLNQYYCDKFFSPGVRKKYVKFNRGYLGGAENQMVFEIDDIVFMGDKEEEYPCLNKDGTLIVSLSQLPEDFIPVSYGIKIGKRVA